MDYLAYRADFDRDGFVIVRQFLPADQFAELRREIDRYIRDVVPTLSANDAFYEDRQRPETLKQLHRMVIEVNGKRHRHRLSSALSGE